MSRRFDEKYDGPALAKCAELGLHPKPWPMGDGHHTEVPPTDEDKRIGEAIAYFLGTKYSDIEGGAEACGRFFYSESTSVDEWTRVARALRIHGLWIRDRTDEQQAPEG